jgi:hypothetical protein
MKSLLTVVTLLSHLAWTSMAGKEDFVGKWKIVKALDEDLQPFSLPEGDFYMLLEENSDDSGGTENNVLSASIKVGNSMGTKIVFGDSTADGDSISVGYLISTRMMPPEHLFRLETFITNTLPKMTTARKETLNSDDASASQTRIIFSGLGQITFEKGLSA